MIEGGASFNGQAALLQVLEGESPGVIDSISTVRNYFQVPREQRVRSLGSEAEVYGPQPATAVLTFDPYQLTRFDLAAGESYTQSYESTAVTSSGGNEFVLASEVESTTTFDGIEEINVAGRSFETCRFTEQTTTSVPGTPASSEVQYRWIHVGSGISIRDKIGDQITELVSATINGESI